MSKDIKTSILILIAVGIVLVFHFQGLSVRVGKDFEFGMGKYYGDEGNE